MKRWDSLCHQNKMKKGAFIAVMLVCLITGPGPSEALEIIGPQENIEWVNTWKRFLKAIVTQDMTAFRKLSAERIRCLFCLENTENETKEMMRLQTTDPDWYETLYEEKVYVPIDTFCKEDYPILFTRELVKRLPDSKLAYAVEEFDRETLYEVIIAITQPDEATSEPEGGLLLFQFIKTPHGYQFWGIDTIP